VAYPVQVLGGEPNGNMPYILVVVAFALVQCAAAVSGLVELGLHPVLAVVIGGALLAFISPLLALPGLYGTIVAWHWHWFWSLALFFPTLILMFTVTGFVSGRSLWQAVTGRPSKTEASTFRLSEDAAVTTDSTPPLPSISATVRDGPSTIIQARSKQMRVAVPVILLISAIAVPVLCSVSGTDGRGARRFAIPSVAPALPDSQDSIAAKPSFDCRAASNPAELAVCQNKSLAALDRQMAGLLASLLLESGIPDDWQVDQLQWSRRVRDACTTVECLDTAYRSRIESLRIAATSPKATVSAGPGGAAAAKYDVLHWSERAPELARNSGAQNYFYRLCGMTAEADELRSRVQETSTLFYEYGKYVLDVELSGIALAMDNFVAGEREARMELVRAGGSPQLACTGDVMRAARARYEVDRNTIAYRPDALAAMAEAVLEAKRARELASMSNKRLPESDDASSNMAPFRPELPTGYAPSRSGTDFRPATAATFQGNP